MSDNLHAEAGIVQPTTYCHPVYTLQGLPEQGRPSLFLAGPTPRRSYVQSWRPSALRMLRRVKTPLVVYYPEPEIKEDWDPDGMRHTEWEREALAASSVILFWIPRNLKTMPGFRTNVEWGFWTAKDPMRLVLGYPPRAPGMASIHNDAARYGIPVASSLSETIDLAIEKLFFRH